MGIKTYRVTYSGSNHTEFEGSYPACIKYVAKHPEYYRLVIRDMDNQLVNFLIRRNSDVEDV